MKIVPSAHTPRAVSSQPARLERLGSGGGAVSPRMTTNRGTAQWMAPECQLVENGLHPV